MTSIIATSHPALIAYFNRDPRWRSVATQMYGNNKGRSRRSMRTKTNFTGAVGFGGHFRSTASFRYHGQQG